MGACLFAAPLALAQPAAPATFKIVDGTPVVPEVAPPVVWDLQPVVEHTGWQTTYYSDSDRLSIGSSLQTAFGAWRLADEMGFISSRTGNPQRSMMVNRGAFTPTSASGAFDMTWNWDIQFIAFEDLLNETRVRAWVRGQPGTEIERTTRWNASFGSADRYIYDGFIGLSQFRNWLSADAGSPDRNTGTAFDFGFPEAPITLSGEVREFAEYPGVKYTRVVLLEYASGEVDRDFIPEIGGQAYRSCISLCGEPHRIIDVSAVTDWSVSIRIVNEIQPAGVATPAPAPSGASLRAGADRGGVADAYHVRFTADPDADTGQYISSVAWSAGSIFEPFVQIAVTPTGAFEVTTPAAIANRVLQATITDHYGDTQTSAPIFVGATVDLEPPFNQLDAFDALRYLREYDAGSIAADLTAPSGIVTQADLLEAIARLTN
ncbi:MAG: hypothetical protein CMJ31_02750 [Phycisphaerae bacterium]|nr:hypothetical protein [Phycisphaerae bacterium]